MYKLIIVEDEELLRNVIPLIINWEAIGFNIVALVQNGKEALKILEEQPIDVVLTDIRMPVMDGLELAGEIKNNYPRTKTILYSAYNNFDYAQKGIDYGVYGYLLKSCDEEELEDYFCDLKKVLDKEHSLISHENPEYWILRNHYFKSIMDTLITSRVDDFFENCKKYNMVLPKGDYFITLFQMNNYDYLVHTHPHNRINEVKQRIISFLIQAIEVPCKGHVFFFDNIYGILWSSHEYYAKDVIEKLYSDLVDELIIYNESDELIITCAISNIHSDIKKLYMAYDDAKNTLQHKLYMNNQLILFFSDMKPIKTKAIDNSNFEALFHEILSNLENKEYDKVLNTLDKGKSRCFNYKLLDTQPVILFCTKIILFTNEHVHQLQVNSLDISIKSFEIIENFKLYDTIEPIFQSTASYLAELLGSIKKNEQTYSRKLVNTALAFIDKHYNEDIKLTHVAEHVNVHPVHLTRLFNQEINQTFKTILIERRIKEAKKLLSQSSYKIYEISEYIGYKKPRYFSELFRKRTSLTPLQYREQYGCVKEDSQ